MDLDKLGVVIDDATMVFRKGDAAKDESIGLLMVTHIYAMPHVSEFPKNGWVQIDCHFIIVGVNEMKAKEHRENLVEILKSYPDLDRLADGPSYIEVGAVIGSQEMAFRLFALGEVLGLWEIVTPNRLGVTGKIADELAGAGLVMITGFFA